MISIILIASSIIFIGGSGGDGAALSSAQRVLAGVSQGARGQAILRNSDTLLIIHNDNTDQDKYRRFIGILYYQEANPDTGLQAGWVAATQGIYLPEGIYFDPKLSKDFGSNRTGGQVSVTLDYPRNSPQNNINFSTSEAPAADSYLFYRFNSNGTSANPNEWLAIRAGQFDASGDLREYDPNGEASGLKSAIIFRRVGTTTKVDDPSAIK